MGLHAAVMTHHQLQHHLHDRLHSKSSGVFVSTGAAAQNSAGPAVSISYLIAGIACTLSVRVAMQTRMLSILNIMGASRQICSPPLLPVGLLLKSTS